ncbi:hypothetical protein B0T14DRAFT_566193 [Immersiella caudata]|uniref:Kelch repeat protein n=1 Tax=Immersiella caudata TaxID=314043 RepID=A0AA39WPW7_9PEZI|nr:hypothetical protein B0T14DRAFT_566193 [Immersiella caudata]
MKFKEAVALLLALSCGRAAAYAVPKPNTLSSRQANSALDNSLFLRRAFHSSAVLNGRVYIDGGEFSYSTNNSVVYQYSNNLLFIDLARNWTNTSVVLYSAAKPRAVPSLRNGGIWVDKENGVLYTGFAGVNSQLGNGASHPQGLWSFTPDSTGAGSWKNLNGSSDMRFTAIPRPFNGQVASGDGSGFFLGGTVGNETSTQVPISGLVTYDFESGRAKNTTVSGVSTGGIGISGRMIYVPNFGSNGILVAMGGDRAGQSEQDEDDLIAFSTVRIYDLGSGTWHEQKTSGNVPLPRKDFCLAGVASSGRTYEMLVYGGWNGNFGSQAIPYDEAFVFSIPGFYWVKASYPAIRPRHGLTCNSVGGGQILAIGGVDTTQDDASSPHTAGFNTPDPRPHSLAIFDMASLNWKSSYTARPQMYIAAPEIRSHYTNNDFQPTSGFDSPKLAAIFSASSFDENAGETPSRHRHSNVGAIAGCVVGGIAACALAGVVICLFSRCHRRRKHRKAMKEAPAKAQRRSFYTCGPRRAQSTVVPRLNGDVQQHEEKIMGSRETSGESPDVLRGMANSPDLHEARVVGNEPFSSTTSTARQTSEAAVNPVEGEGSSPVSSQKNEDRNDRNDRNERIETIKRDERTEDRELYGEGPMGEDRPEGTRTAAELL